jgi:chromosome segregation ATPase
MANNDEVIFDDKSGIPVEEQKEILAQINGITEKNRKSLSQGGKTGYYAKKSGAVFPLVVNIAALVVLGFGTLFLILFNTKIDAQVKTGGAVYNLTEKALIEEIRKETAQKIAAKEMEISSITLRLEEVDNQLIELYSIQDLTIEQLAAQKELIALQASYRDELSALQEERARILEDSRSREAALRAQLEERAREFASVRQRTSDELDSARSEIARLSGEGEKIAAIDAQFAGGLAYINGFVKDGRYDEAAKILENLRYLCNNNPLSSSRSFAVKKEFYNKSLDSIEAMIANLRKSGSPSNTGQPEMQEINNQLENRIAEMQKTIDAFNSGSSGQARRVSELEGSVKSLESEKNTLSQTVAARDSSIRELESRSTSQAQEIANLRNQIDVIRQALLEN